MRYSFSHTAHRGPSSGPWKGVNNIQVTPIWATLQGRELDPPPKTLQPLPPLAGLKLFSRRKWDSAKVVPGAWERAIPLHPVPACSPPRLGARMPLAACPGAERGRPQTLSHRASLLEGSLPWPAGHEAACVCLSCAFLPTSLSSPLPPNPFWPGVGRPKAPGHPVGSLGAGPHVGPVAPRGLPPSSLLSPSVEHPSLFPLVNLDGWNCGSGGSFRFR